jgi:hypothetical protein
MRQENCSTPPLIFSRTQRIQKYASAAFFLMLRYPLLCFATVYNDIGSDDRPGMPINHMGLLRKTIFSFQRIEAGSKMVLPLFI